MASHKHIWLLVVVVSTALSVVVFGEDEEEREGPFPGTLVHEMSHGPQDADIAEANTEGKKDQPSGSQHTIIHEMQHHAQDADNAEAEADRNTISVKDEEGDADDNFVHHESSFVSSSFSSSSSFVDNGKEKEKSFSSRSTTAKMNDGKGSIKMEATELGPDGKPITAKYTKTFNLKDNKKSPQKALVEEEAERQFSDWDEGSGGSDSDTSTTESDTDSDDAYDDDDEGSTEDAWPLDEPDKVEDNTARRVPTSS